MKYHYKTTQQMAGFLVGACLLLFAVYSMSTFYGYGGDLALLLHYMKSGQYAPDTRSLVAIIGTILSILPALILYRVFDFPLRYKALALLPSYIILGVLSGTSIQDAASTDTVFPIVTTILLSLITILAILAALTIYESRSEHSPLSVYLVPNIVVHSVGILFTLTLTPADIRLHQQLYLSHQLHQQHYTQVTAHPYHAISRSDRNTLAMYLYALSVQDQLTQQLHTISSHKGSQSLIPQATPLMRMQQIPQAIYRHIGAAPTAGSHPPVAIFLEQAIHQRIDTLRVRYGQSAQPESEPIIRYYQSVLTPQDHHLIDYYLCSLLLDGKTDEFCAELPKYYPIDSLLPKAYTDALQQATLPTQDKH